MPIKYDVKKTKIGFGKDKSEAYVGRIQLGSTITAEKLEEQVAIRTLLSPSVVHTVLNNIVASVCHFVKEGQGVLIGELGILRPSINTKSAADGDDVEVEKVRVRWFPGKKVREAAANFAIKKMGDGSDVDMDDDDIVDGGAAPAKEDRNLHKKLWLPALIYARTLVFAENIGGATKTVILLEM